jgi:hypothetical protein
VRILWNLAHNWLSLGQSLPGTWESTGPRGTKSSSTPNPKQNSAGHRDQGPGFACPRRVGCTKASSRIPVTITAKCLQLHPRAVTRYFNRHGTGGTTELFRRRRTKSRDDEQDKQFLFSALHSPPSLTGYPLKCPPPCEPPPPCEENESHPRNVSTGSKLHNH